MQRIIFLLLSCLYGSILLGQQIAHQTMYRENWLLVNPASYSNDYLTAGRTNTLAITGRYQWTRLQNPISFTAAQFQSVLEDNHFSIGGVISNDQTGAISNSGIYGNFSYRMILNNRPTEFLSVGLQAGIRQYRVNVSEIRFSDASNVLLDQDQLSSFDPDFGLGAFYYLDKKLYAGIALPQIFELETTLSTEENGFNIERSRHLFGSIGTYIPIAYGYKQYSYIEPSAIIRYAANAPVSVDFMLRYNYRNTFLIGAGAGNSNHLFVEVGYILNNLSFSDQQLRLGFAYNYNTSSYGNVLGSTFELNVNYAWGASSQIDCPWK